MAKQTRTINKVKPGHRASKASRCPECGRRTRRGQLCQFRGGTPQVPESARVKAPLYARDRGGKLGRKSRVKATRVRLHDPERKVSVIPPGLRERKANNHEDRHEAKKTVMQLQAREAEAARLAALEAELKAHEEEAARVAEVVTEVVDAVIASQEADDAITEAAEVIL